MVKSEDTIISYIVSGGEKQMRYFVVELANALYPTVIESIRAGKCPFCGETFKSRGLLKRHLLQIHSEELKNIADNVLETYTKFKTAAQIKRRGRGTIAVKVNGTTLTFTSRRELAKFIAENFA